MIKLKNEVNCRSVEVKAMKIGQVGRISEWPCSSYIGTYVVRSKLGLNELDPQRTAANHVWSNVEQFDKRFKVEIVEPGTVFEFTIDRVSEKTS